MSRVAFHSALILLLSALTACSYNPFIGNDHTTGSPAVGILGAGLGAGAIKLVGGSRPYMAIAGAATGAFAYYLTTLRYDAAGIMQAGGQVYTVGDFVGIYIPSDGLFDPNTAELLPQAGFILDSAVAVLNRFPNNNIIVSGNTCGFAKARWEQALSEKRAQVVSAYLWNAGIKDAKAHYAGIRRLNYVGYGNYFPIAIHYTNDGIRANSRIQITAYPNQRDLRFNMGQQWTNIGMKCKDHC